MADENQQVVDVPAEQVPAAVETEQSTETQPTETVQEATDGGEVKKGAAGRIKELNQQVKSLNERVAELTQIPDTQQYQPTVQPGEEITPQRYSEDVTKVADSIVSLRMKQLEAQTRLKAETSEVQREFPQLNPKSNEFDSELSETITEAVEAHIRVNPYNASVTKFVGKLMKPYAKQVEKEVGQERANLAKQVTQTALRPTSVKPAGEKSARDMSIKELEAKLGIVTH